MREPIIVVSDDIDLFETFESAERYLEPADLRSANIRYVYDRDGRLLRPTIVKGMLGAERLKIEDTSDPPHVERFRDAIIELLVKSTQEPLGTFTPSSLEELIARAMPYKTR